MLKLSADLILVSSSSAPNGLHLILRIPDVDCPQTAPTVHGAWMAGGGRMIVKFASWYPDFLPEFAVANLSPFGAQNSGDGKAILHNHQYSHTCNPCKVDH